MADPRFKYKTASDAMPGFDKYDTEPNRHPLARTFINFLGIQPYLLRFRFEAIPAVGFSETGPRTQYVDNSKIVDAVENIYPHRVHLIFSLTILVS